jgi:hypothetical protein
VYADVASYTSSYLMFVSPLLLSWFEHHCLYHHCGVSARYHGVSPADVCLRPSFSRSFGCCIERMCGCKCHRSFEPSFACRSPGRPGEHYETSTFYSWFLTDHTPWSSQQKGQVHGVRTRAAEDCGIAESRRRVVGTYPARTCSYATDSRFCFPREPQ